MKEKSYIHIKSQKRYEVFGHGKVQIADIWYDSVFYTDENGAMYCRTKIDFDKKFNPFTTIT